MAPRTVSKLRQTSLKQDRFGWYVDGDLSNNQVADLHSELLVATDHNERVRLASEILAIIPGHIESLTAMAWMAPTLEARLDLLRKAVEIGKEAWHPAFTSEIEVQWWWEIGTRPFIRAIRAYEVALREAGLAEEADHCHTTLVEMGTRSGEPNTVVYLYREKPSDDRSVPDTNEPKAAVGGPRPK